jgi:predicted acylesterase/phospholipase RssA
MRYNKGIYVDHVVASSSVPINYNYAEVKIDYDDISKGSRKFWDGGLSGLLDCDFTSVKLE